MPRQKIRQRPSLLIMRIPVYLCLIFRQKLLIYGVQYRKQKCTCIKKQTIAVNHPSHAPLPTFCFWLALLVVRDKHIFEKCSRLWYGGSHIEIHM